MGLHLPEGRETPDGLTDAFGAPDHGDPDWAPSEWVPPGDHDAPDLSEAPDQGPPADEEMPPLLSEERPIDVDDFDVDDWRRRREEWFSWTPPDDQGIAVERMAVTRYETLVEQMAEKRLEWHRLGKDWRTLPPVDRQAEIERAVTEYTCFHAFLAWTASHGVATDYRIAFHPHRQPRHVGAFRTQSDRIDVVSRAVQALPKPEWTFRLSARQVMQAPNVLCFAFHQRKDDRQDVHLVGWASATDLLTRTRQVVLPPKFSWEKMARLAYEIRVADLQPMESLANRLLLPP